MAASSSVPGSEGRAPPPNLVAFYSLVHKRNNAGMLCRHSRAAELSARTATEAESLFVVRVLRPPLRARTPSPRVLGGSHLLRASCPRLLRGHAMASSSSQQGAREVPPPDQLEAFYSFADNVVTAGALHRHSRNVELSARAALKAEALLGGDSLVVGHLRMNESEALVHLAITTSGAEQVALFRRSCSALLLVIPLLQRRLTTNTLLPGAVRKEESDYYAHVQAAIHVAHNKQVPLQLCCKFWVLLLDIACFSMRCTGAWTMRQQDMDTCCRSRSESCWSRLCVLSAPLTCPSCH